MSSARGKLGGVLLRPARCGLSRARSTRKRHGGAYLLGLRRLGVRPARPLHPRTASPRRSCARGSGRAEDSSGRPTRRWRAAGALRRSPASAPDASLPQDEPLTRDQVFALIRDHLADELDLDPPRSPTRPASRRIWRPTRSTSTRSSRSSRTPTACRCPTSRPPQILTVGAAVDFVLANDHAVSRARRATMLLADLLEELPEDLARQVFTHASWSERRGDSYTRLAFLGDSVLALAVTDPPVPASGGRALRRRAADEDPRAGGLGRLLPGGGGAARRCPSGCAPRRRAGVRGERRRAGREPSACSPR